MESEGDGGGSTPVAQDSTKVVWTAHNVAIVEKGERNFVGQGQKRVNHTVGNQKAGSRSHPVRTPGFYTVDSLP